VHLQAGEINHPKTHKKESKVMRKILIFLGFCRNPLPPIQRTASVKELARMNQLLRLDREMFP
jgi:hypothetical protein